MATPTTQAPTPFDDPLSTLPDEQQLEPTPEPVRIPIDEQGNPLPVKNFKDLCERNGLGPEPNIYKGLPEAAGIAWTDANLQKSDKGLTLSVNRLNITARGITPVAALQDLLRTLAYAESLGIKVHLEPAAQSVATKPATMTQAAQALGGVTKPIQPAALAKAATPAKPAAPAPVKAQETLSAEGEGKARVVKIVSQPLPGGKWILKFHEAGHPKYPDYSTYKAGIDTDAVMAILDQSGYEFTPDMLNPVQEVAFDVNVECYWKYSSAVKKDGVTHYRNFVRLAPVGQ